MKKYNSCFPIINHFTHCLLILMFVFLASESIALSNTIPQSYREKGEGSNSCIVNELNSLKEFINSSVWILCLSQNLTDNEAVNSAEQTYSQSLHENKRMSEIISEKLLIT